MASVRMDRDLARAPYPHSPILIQGRQKPGSSPNRHGDVEAHARENILEHISRWEAAAIGVPANEARQPGCNLCWFCGNIFRLPSWQMRESRDAIFRGEKFLQRRRQHGGQFLPGEQLQPAAQGAAPDGPHHPIPLLDQIRAPRIAKHAERAARGIGSERAPD